MVGRLCNNKTGILGEIMSGRKSCFGKEFQNVPKNYYKFSKTLFLFWFKKTLFCSTMDFFHVLFVSVLISTKKLHTTRSKILFFGAPGN